MASKKELIAEAEQLGIDLTGDESITELREKITEAQEGNGAGGDQVDTGPKSEKPKAKPVKAQTKVDFPLVWLKTRAYINDRERLNPGLYTRLEMTERLEMLSRRSSALEVLEEVSFEKLFEIAETFGIKKPQRFKEEELLQMLVSEPRPFTLV